MKKMRMLSMLLALLLVFSLSLSVLADDAAKITVESWTEPVNAGDEVTLAVSIENNPGFWTSVWKIGYDSSKLALQSVNTAYSVEIAGKTVEIPYMSGTYTPLNLEDNTIGLMNATSITDNGTIFTLTFLVKEGAAAGETAVSVTAKELFVKDCETVAAVSVSGGVTIADSTGGSTTGGSTTGGSTTGGSTTGGSTTGGSTTGGSTTGGSTTGGSTTGGSTTGGSTTGGSTTGGSTTGGSTTGGSTTGGSTTGGSTTGGSTTGGSTTGGSTTGGSTTGSERTVELVGQNNSATYTITGDTLNVQNSVACVVLWTEDGGETYRKLAATANEAGGYDFDLASVPANAVIKIAIKGDVNGDGVLGFADATMVMNAYGNDAPLSKLAELVADVDGVSGIQFADATRIMNAWGNDQYLDW